MAPSTLSFRDTAAKPAFRNSGYIKKPKENLQEKSETDRAVGFRNTLPGSQLVSVVSQTK